MYLHSYTHASPPLDVANVSVVVVGKSDAKVSQILLDKWNKRINKSKYEGLAWIDEVGSL
jgi:surfactin synthase thioesterase subunit